MECVYERCEQPQHVRARFHAHVCRYASGFLFTVLYFLEFVIKATAIGFATGNNSYLRDGWNVLDFVLLLGGLVATPFATLAYFDAAVSGSGDDVTESSVCVFVSVVFSFVTFVPIACC